MKVGCERTGNGVGWLGPYSRPAYHGQETTSGSCASKITASIRGAVTEVPDVHETGPRVSIIHKERKSYEIILAITAGYPLFPAMGFPNQCHDAGWV